MTMRDEMHFQEDDLIQYALGTLPSVQLHTMSAHLSMCSQCREVLVSTQMALGAWSATGEMAELPAGAKTRFLQKMESTEARQSAAQSRAARGRAAEGGRLREIFEWFQSPLVLKSMAGAFALGLVLVAVDDVSRLHENRQILARTGQLQARAAQLDEIESFLRGSDAMAVSLHEKPETMKAPEGRAIYSSRTGKLIFTASNLPQVAPGKAYELWILPAKGGAPVPAGLFTPNAKGDGAVIFPELPPNVAAIGFGVTLENASGSDKPTSPILLVGE